MTIESQSSNERHYAVDEMYVSLLRNLRKVTKLEQPDSLYSQFTHVPSPPGKFGLCSIEHCASEFVSAGSSSEDWCLCPEHYLLVSRPIRRKHLRALFWQSAVLNCFSDPRVSEEIVSSDRYPKLCKLFEHVTERVAITWRAVVLEAQARVEKKRKGSRVKLKTH